MDARDQGRHVTWQDDQTRSHLTPCLSLKAPWRPGCPTINRRDSTFARQPSHSPICSGAPLTSNQAKEGIRDPVELSKMAEEAQKPETTTEVPQVAASLDSGATNGLPAHAVQAEALQKDIVMSDAPADQPAVSFCPP